jgi:UDP-N-acetylglucosamine--N-acetylmuramyl-(pentapeptide) pyrophosphoryl-undecaprenol N-acetylglucosamine transferase
MKVVLAAGGTGGHLYPAVAVAEKLRALGVETLFMVSNRGLEKDVLSKLNFNYKEQDLSAFAGVNFISKSKAIVKLIKGINFASKHITKRDKILSFGGYAAAPAAFAGLNLGAELYIHEQNSVMGSLNKVISVFARRIFTSYKNTLSAPGRAICVGNPVRKDFMNRTVKPFTEKRILVLGGSGGSRIINKTVAETVPELISGGYTIVHQTGRKLLEEANRYYGEYLGNLNSDKLKIVDYIDDMSGEYQAADMVIARAGSGTVFETLYSRRPAIYIPFAKASKNHQYHNAKAMKDAGYAALIKESDFNREALESEIAKLFMDMEKYKMNLSVITAEDSAQKIVKFMDIL